MSLVAVATFFSFLALCSGIAVVGSGRHFDYEIKELVQGRVNAIMYIWVIFSTIFSMGHFLVLLDYGLTFHWGYRHPDTVVWMILHTGVGLLFTSAHLGVRRYLSHGNGDKFMWGSKRCAD